MKKKIYAIKNKNKKKMIDKHFNNVYWKKMPDGKYKQFNGEWYWVKKEGKYIQVGGKSKWKKQIDGKYIQVPLY